MVHNVGRKRCSRSSCEKSFVPHRWGNSEARFQGWFLQRNGEAWCPDHHPDWVTEWRAKKKAEKEAKAPRKTGSIYDIFKEK